MIPGRPHLCSFHSSSRCCLTSFLLRTSYKAVVPCSSTVFFSSSAVEPTSLCLGFGQTSTNLPDVVGHTGSLIQSQIMCVFFVCVFVNVCQYLCSHVCQHFCQLVCHGCCIFLSTYLSTCLSRMYGFCVAETS